METMGIKSNYIRSLVVTLIGLLLSFISACAPSPQERLAGKWDSVELHQDHGTIGWRGWHLKEQWYNKDCEPRSCDRFRVGYEFFEDGTVVVRRRFVTDEEGPVFDEDTGRFRVLDDSRLVLTQRGEDGSVLSFAFEDNELHVTDSAGRTDYFVSVEQYSWR
jgi:hypothetical protein